MLTGLVIKHMVNSACKHLAVKLTWLSRLVIPVERICIEKYSAVNSVPYTPCLWYPMSQHGSNNSHGRTQTSDQPCVFEENRKMYIPHNIQKNTIYIIVYIYIYMCVCVCVTFSVKSRLKSKNVIMSYVIILKPSSSDPNAPNSN